MVMGRRHLLALLVEDNPVTTNVMQSLLKVEGWEVIPAKSVPFALETLRYNPSCIVLDLMLPGGSGAEILQAVRDQKLSAKVVVITGTHDQQLLERVRLLKPDLTLFKPVDLPELLKFLDQVRGEFSSSVGDEK
jgi:CheY-like chemotaxis protein